MKKILIIAVLIFIIGLSIGSYFYLKSRIFKFELLEIGEKASYFELKTADGRNFDLADYNGNKILLVFFDIDCSSCLKQLANLKKIKEKVGKELEIITISESDEVKTQEFVRSYNLNFPVLIDDKEIFKRKYKGIGLPAFYLLDEEMKVRYRRIGYRSPDLDERIISEFERTNKIPIEIYSGFQIDNFFIDNFETSISALMAKEIALKDPETRIFIRENLIYPEQRVEIINLRWLAEERNYKWIIQIIEPPCDCPDKKINTLNIVKIEIDPISGQILDRELIKELPDVLYKEMLYQDVIGYSLLVNGEK